MFDTCWFVTSLRLICFTLSSIQQSSVRAGFNKGSIAKVLLHSFFLDKVHIYTLSNSQLWIFPISNSTAAQKHRQTSKTYRLPGKERRRRWLTFDGAAASWCFRRDVLVKYSFGWFGFYFRWEPPGASSTCFDAPRIRMYYVWVWVGVCRRIYSFLWKLWIQRQKNRTQDSWQVVY